MERTSTLETADGPMNLHEARPDGPERGAVVVIQEAFGITDHIQDVCRRFAAEGYAAVAPHLFHRSGDPVIGYDEAANTVPHLKQLSARGIEADLEATVGHLAREGFTSTRTAVVGFCMGGSVALLAAARHRLGAAVTFYGGGIAEGRFGIPALVELAADLKTPWLGLYGDGDQSIPVDQVESLRKALETTALDHRIERYPQAGHGFHCDARSSYHETSARQAWQETLKWLATHLKDR